MRIALVILHADPTRGGAERYTTDLAVGLAGRRHEVSLLASSFPVVLVGADPVVIPARGATRARRYNTFLDNLDRHLDQTRYDIVHAMLPVRRCDVYHPHAGIAQEAVATGHLKHDAAPARLLSKVAIRLNARRQRFAAVERERLESARPPVVLCLSEYVKQFVRKHYTLPESKLRTLFNAVNLQRFDPTIRPEAGAQVRGQFSIGPDKVVALMIAQDFARKGLRQSIEALAQVDDPRLVLLVFGKQDPSPYADLARRLGVKDRVIFGGTTSDPQAAYQSADFFVLPTRHDPCSLVVLEALAMGLPVISTRFNGACEIMTDGTHGFVLPNPSDVDALAGAMRQMLDADRRQTLRQACLRLRPELSYERHLDQLLRIYSVVR
ncbi:MAG TPA: glycosyltransferase family 4 protein [Tepidisphaeraceae bacterium]|nr:glycosyltransferase family 4 protein [Tepidisphaeraceae bacterium]